MTASPLKLVQLTDTHLFADPLASLRKVQPLPSLEATLRAAAQDIRHADAILSTGDLVQDDPGGYAHFRTAFATLGRPVLCIPGNHDDAAALSGALCGEPFQVGGHVDFPDWRIILLDSSVPHRSSGRLSDAELTRLDAALASTPGHALIALHHHPVPMSSAWLDTVGLENGPEFFAIVDRHPCARAIVFGHVHQNFERVRGGVSILGTPSTCVQFLPQVQHFAVDRLPPAWRTLALHADGRVTSEVHWLDEAARPQFTVV